MQNFLYNFCNLDVQRLWDNLEEAEVDKNVRERCKSRYERGDAQGVSDVEGK